MGELKNNYVYLGWMKVIFFSFSQNYKRAESDREQSRDNMFRQHFIKKTEQEKRNFQEGREGKESGVR